MDASLSGTGLQQTIDAFLATGGEEMPHAVPGIGEGMLTPLALAGDIDTIEAWLEAQGIAADDMDKRTRAAYLIGGIAWSVCVWIAAFDLTGKPALRRVGVRQERYWYRHEDFAHEYVRYPIAIETDPEAGPADHRVIIEELFAPLIAAVMVTSGLSAGAQWRLVSDSVAQAYQHVGEQLGIAEQAREIATDILAEGRLANGKTSFVEIPLPHRTHWYVSRGGCCRYYTTRGGEYCSSCVLRKRDDQIARYRDYFESIQTLE
jgi:hypothetical protein